MKKILLVIIGLIILPIVINAQNKIYFENDEVYIEPGETYDVNIKVLADSDFTNVDFNVISTLQQIKLSSIKINENFINNSEKGYSLEASEPQKSGTVIATLTIKADSKAIINQTALIKIIKSQITTNKKYDLEDEILTVNIKDSMKSNYLSSLSSKIAPFEFDKNKQEYEVEVDSDVEEFDLVANLEDEKATVSISSQKLDKRKNIINVKVSRDMLEDRIYKVIVKKELNKNISKDIVKDNKENQKIANKIKFKWILIIIGLFVVLIINFFFLKKNKQ